jgi:hypothetical protein
MSLVHGRGMTAEAQAASVRVPRVPTTKPATAPNSSGRCTRTTASSSTRHRGSEVERERRGDLTQHRPTRTLTDAADDQEEAGGGQRAPAAIQTRAQTSATPAQAAMSMGWQDQAELRHAEVELALEDRQADEQAADRLTPGRTKAAMPFLVDGGAVLPALAPSCSRTSRPTSDRPAPPMSMRWVGPHSVTSWPNSRCHTSSSGKPEQA